MEMEFDEMIIGQKFILLIFEEFAMWHLLCKVLKPRSISDILLLWHHWPRLRETGICMMPYRYADEEGFSPNSMY